MTATTVRGFPCCVWSPMPTCRRPYPGRSDGACSLVDLHRQRPSLCNSQVGSCKYLFEACSAFTHVMACTLAESPSDPLHRRLRQLRCLRRRFDCYRVERTSSRAGVAPAEHQRLFHGALLRQLYFPTMPFAEKKHRTVGTLSLTEPKGRSILAQQFGRAIGSQMFRACAPRRSPIPVKPYDG